MIDDKSIDMNCEILSEKNVQCGITQYLNGVHEAVLVQQMIDDIKTLMCNLQF